MKANQKESKTNEMNKKRKMFINLGFIMALSMVLVAFEWNFDHTRFQDVMPLGMEVDDMEAMPEIQIVPEPKLELKQPEAPKPVTDQIVIVSDGDIDKKTTTTTSTQTGDDDIIPPYELIPDEDDGSTEIVEFPQYQAEPIGGKAFFDKTVAKYIVNNMRAMDKRTMLGTYTAYVMFVVEKDGTISNAEFIGGKNTGFSHVDLLILKAVSEATLWDPAQMDGRIVRQRIQLPVVLRMSN